VYCFSIFLFVFIFLKTVSVTSHCFPFSFHMIEVFERANNVAYRNINKEIKIIFQTMGDRQIILFAHLLRADMEDNMKKISMDEQGRRINAGHKRPGYDIVREKVVNKLQTDGILPTPWSTHMNEEEMLQVVVDAANNRHI